MELLKYFYTQYTLRTAIVFITITIASIITAITLTALPALLLKLLGRTESRKARLLDELFIQMGIDPSPTNLLTILVIGIILQNILLGGAKIYAGFTKAKIVKDLRIKLLSSMSNTEWKFFQNQSGGRLASCLITEAEMTGNGYLSSVEILSSIVQVLAYLSVAFFLSWEIALVAIIVSLSLIALFSKFITMTRKLGSQDANLLREFTAHLTDLTRGVKSLKAMGRESYANAILDNYTKKIKTVSKKTTTITELLNAIQEIVLMVIIIFTIYYSFKNLTIPIEFAVILIFLFIRAMKLVGKAHKTYQTFAGQVAGYDGVRQLIQSAIHRSEKRPGTIKHSLLGNIRFENLSFGYTVDNPIFSDINETIYHNKLNSIVGPSGIGKTSLVDVICGLYRPLSGSIYIDDVLLSEMDIRHWRKQIGYVVQETTLLHSTIKENVTLGDPNYSDKEIKLALERAHALNFVDTLPDGIYSTVGESGSMLSGGQRQRILIARALVHSPKLLILDEATSALDRETEISIGKVFKELSKEVTIISISHRPALVDASDHIIELQGIQDTH